MKQLIHKQIGSTEILQEFDENGIAVWSMQKDRVSAEDWAAAFAQNQVTNFEDTDEYAANMDAQTKSEALQQISSLEKRAIRPLRALMLNPDNAEERTRLADIESQIAELRKVLVHVG